METEVRRGAEAQSVIDTGRSVVKSPSALVASLACRLTSRSYHLCCDGALVRSLSYRLRCLIPRFDGVILSQAWREALWDKFVTGAPDRKSVV